LFSFIDESHPDDAKSFHIHFIGICGTAMAGVAAELHSRGFRVTGSDSAAYPPMSTFLASLGLEVIEGFDEKNLSPAPDLVVVGNAASRGNPEVEAVLNRRLSYCSLPELIGRAFLEKSKNLVVAGTHGKTTTSALCAWILKSAGMNPGWLVGGAPLDLDCGFFGGGGDFFVLEGDEYDTAFFDKRSKFIHYRPWVLILNNLEFDHADIFDSIEDIRRSFRHLIRTIPSSGALVVNKDDVEAFLLAGDAPCPVVTYSLCDPSADWYARVAPASPKSPASANSQGRVKITGPDEFSFEVKHNLVGRHQTWNILAAIASASALGAGIGVIGKALSSFRGVKRRGELRGEVGGVKVYDDFAHHPTAIRSTLQGFRDLYPGNRLWAVMEPRSNTMRRKLFQRELTTVFNAVDGVCIREVPNPEKTPENDRLDSACLAGDLRVLGKEAHSFSDAGAIIAWLAPRLEAGDVVVILSNGGFEDIHDRLLKALAAPQLQAPESPNVPESQKIPEAKDK